MSVSSREWYYPDRGTIIPLARMCSPSKVKLGPPCMWLSGTQTHGIRTALVSPIFPYLSKGLRERTREGFLCRAGMVTTKDLEPDERLGGLGDPSGKPGDGGGIFYV